MVRPLAAGELGPSEVSEEEAPVLKYCRGVSRRQAKSPVDQWLVAGEREVTLRWLETSSLKKGETLTFPATTQLTLLTVAPWLADDCQERRLTCLADDCQESRTDLVC